MFQEKIRIGTLVSAAGDPAGYIRQILTHGFESFQLTFWQELGDADIPRMAAEVKEALADSGVVISALGIYGNPLSPDAPKYEETRRGWQTLVENAHLFGCDLVCGFTGCVTGKSVDEGIQAFGEFFGPLSEKAADHGVRLAFENCDMGGSWKSPTCNLAMTPPAWELLFNEVDRENIGLEWEPCHQLVKLLDPMPQLRRWTPRIFHVHGKDATIHWDVIRAEGILGATPFAFHRTPGFGDSNWTEIISELRRHGYEGSIDIEGWHDPVYRGDLEMTGQVHALNHLLRCRGGSFVPNPE